MLDQRPASRLAGTGHDIDDALGKADFLNELPETDRRQRRLLRRLQNYGASGCKRGRNLSDRHPKWHIPRHDLAHDTHGFRTCVRVVFPWT